MGVKILLGGYPLGEYDVLIIVEAADDTTAASVALAVTAGGAVKSSRPPGPDDSVPAAPGSFAERPVNNSGWPRRVGLKIGSQESPS
jgi:hypothetical protein